MHPPDPLYATVADPRYPIGRLREQPIVSRQESLRAIAELPGRLSIALAGLAAEQLETPYREGGWTLRQLAHHVADSHINACVRLRLALTEEWPAIKPYNEAAWAELVDARMFPIENALALLAPLHARWTALLESIPEDAWESRGYTHPENGRTSIAAMTSLYGWHGRHHTGHVLALRERMGW